MPWKIELKPFGEKGDLRPVKIYPSGMSAMPTDEEVAVWKHVNEIEAELNEHRQKVKDNIDAIDTLQRSQQPSRRK